MEHATNECIKALLGTKSDYESYRYNQIKHNGYKYFRNIQQEAFKEMFTL